MAPPKLAVKANLSPFLTLWNSYYDETPSRLKVIDSFLIFIMASGIIQFAYCVLITTYPYNAFLSGPVRPHCSLRSQVNPTNREQFKGISPQRAFADFAVGSIVLHFFVFNFLG
ncbi:hypothetical protein BS47DRAFT_1370494 [Hydnum rufescens UP504]|uniref:Dolichyl-diphosphooligosaccharide--protein glycosyltransferase subunit OST2 n=1 Tax=Hydnum rufescens UP504 TaxID=1448309 RepID=A0A9P6BAD6_9AGAM|nr:hypothetical protein BS47DRAFT_1370494 [Hydnum rufescens UP504]